MEHLKVFPVKGGWLAIHRGDCSVLREVAETAFLRRGVAIWDSADK